MTRNWKENNATTNEDSIWDKDREPVLEGALVKIEQNVGSHSSTLYTIKKDDGTELKVWGSTVLDDRFLGVIAGTYVRVNYKGLTKGKNGKSYHNYSVDVDQDSAPQVAPTNNVDKVFPVKDDEEIDLSKIPF